MLNLDDWEIIDIHETLSAKYENVKVKTLKLLELGVIDLNEAKQTIQTYYDLTDKFYCEIQKRMKQC